MSCPYQHLIGALSVPLIPCHDNCTPPQRTPWGGKEIVRRYKSHLGMKSDWIVGESWEISGHPSFPSQCRIGDVTVPLDRLALRAPEQLLGHHRSMPFLVKLLNSGSWLPAKARWTEILSQHAPDLLPLLDGNYHELHCGIAALLKSDRLPDLLQAEAHLIYQEMIRNNLSIQVHPPSGLYAELPSKTEAWLILDAEPGAGIYLGLHEGVERVDFEHAMREGEELSQFLNFVSVAKGDIFFIPSGTLHAIGAGVLLLEPQESSETTFRCYDWNRTIAGQLRELHVEESMQSIDWKGLRGGQLVDSLRRTSIGVEGGWQPLIEVPEFQSYQLRLHGKGRQCAGSTVTTGIQGCVVLDGTVSIHPAKGSACTVQKGQSVVLPAAVGCYHIKTLSDNAELVMTTAAPQSTA